MSDLVRIFAQGNQERATQLSRMWVGALEPLVASKRKKGLVDEVFRQCAGDLTRTIDNGEASEVRPTLRAGIEFALRVVETRNRVMIALVLDNWVPLLEYAFEKYASTTEEVVTGFAKKFDLSTDPHRIEARILTYTMFLALERALRKGDEKVNVVNCVVANIRAILLNNIPDDATLSADWLEALFISGKEVRLHQVALATATVLLRLKDSKGKTELFEGTIAEVLRWSLRTAHAAERLDDVEELIAKLAKGQITSGEGLEGSEVRDKDAVRKLFKLAMDSLDFSEPDTSIREALRKVDEEIDRIPE